MTDYVIWSFEHRAWWGPNRCGYTAKLDEAGRYSKADAGEIVTSSIWCEEVAMLVTIAEQNGHPEYSPWGERGRPMSGVNDVEFGDYVLATKYSDGDPCDHFFVGFVYGRVGERYLVADGNGVSQRPGGFRRVEKITADEGRELVGMIPVIADNPGKSLWWHLDEIRKKLKGDQ